MNLFTREIESQMQNTNLWLPGGKGGRKDKSGDKLGDCR